jgi:hypothetical protein
MTNHSVPCHSSAEQSIWSSSDQSCNWVSRLSNTHTHTCLEPTFNSNQEPTGGWWVESGVCSVWVCLQVGGFLCCLSTLLDIMTSLEWNLFVKISGVKTDLNGLLYHEVHITCGLVQDGALTEISVVPQWITLSGPDICISCSLNLVFMDLPVCST